MKFGVRSQSAEDAAVLYSCRSITTLTNNLVEGDMRIGINEFNQE